MRKKTKVDPMDKAIEQAYYRLAVGRQINVLKIGALYAEVRAKLVAGFTMDSAMMEAINKYCVRYD